VWEKKRGARRFPARGEFQTGLHQNARGLTGMPEQLAGFPLTEAMPSSLPPRHDHGHGAAVMLGCTVVMGR
jgi:hypothetical protein